MCIAIVKPKDKTISKDILETCYYNNPNGCGFSYIKDDDIYINKYMGFEDFYEDYIKVETTSPMLIHFRIATHGGVNLENTHPFKLNDRMVLIHNGIISGYGDKGEGKSDTRDFIDKVIGNISHKMWRNPSFIKLVGDAIGYSKLGVLDNKGNYYIVNEHKGNWTDGVWYSNESFKPKVVKYNSQYTTKSTTKSTNDFGLRIIWKCDRCGKTFKTEDSIYHMYEQCEHCGSYFTEEVGWEENGKDFYFNDVELVDKV